MEQRGQGPETAWSRAETVIYDLSASRVGFRPVVLKEETWRVQGDTGPDEKSKIDGGN